MKVKAWGYGRPLLTVQNRSETCENFVFPHSHGLVGSWLSEDSPTTILLRAVPLATQFVPRLWGRQCTIAFKTGTPLMQNPKQQKSPNTETTCGFNLKLLKLLENQKILESSGKGSFGMLGAHPSFLRPNSWLASKVADKAPGDKKPVIKSNKIRSVGSVNGGTWNKFGHNWAAKKRVSRPERRRRHGSADQESWPWLQI